MHRDPFDVGLSAVREPNRPSLGGGGWTVTDADLVSDGITYESRTRVYGASGPTQGVRDVIEVLPLCES